jgi:hypothetical protein
MQQPGKQRQIGVIRLAWHTSPGLQEPKGFAHNVRKPGVMADFVFRIDDNGAKLKFRASNCCHSRQSAVRGKILRTIGPKEYTRHRPGEKLASALAEHECQCGLEILINRF